MIGYAFCGSFCTHAASLKCLKSLSEAGEDILPIMSDTAFSTDTRFGKAEDIRRKITDICGREIIHTVREAEPIGPLIALEALIIAPCTGNTLARLALGLTDGAVTMAAKAHLRSDRSLLIALASNDAMSANLSSIAELLRRKSIYFVPLKQDDPVAKPHSLVADFSLIPDSLAAMREKKQLRPLFL